MNENISHIRELIVKGRIEDTFPILKKELQGSDKYDSVLLQEARFSEIKEEEISGTINNSEAHKLNNQVVKAILKIISDWEKNLSGKPVKSENSSSKLVEETLLLDIASGYKNAMKFYFWIALLPIALSLSFIAFEFFNNKIIETLQALASTLIASLSAFPIREIVNRKEKISILNVLIKKIRILKMNPIELEIEKVNEVFWDLLNDTLAKSN